MSRHLRSRLAVLTGVAAVALLLPATAAVADDSTPSASSQEAVKSDPTATASASASAAQDAKTAAEKKAEADAEAIKKGTGAPQGGVAAGEKPADQGGDGTTTVLLGSAAGALLLAGAGTVIMRRRTADRRNA